jgi:hypothetical protein
VGCTVTTSCVGVLGAMVNGVLVAPVRPAALAVNVYPVPVRLSDSVVKVATPATAGTVAVPDSVALPGLAPSATVTAPVKAVAVLPILSRAVTTTAGVIASPAVSALGWVVKNSATAGAGLTLNAALVAPVRLVALAPSV